MYHSWTYLILLLFCLLLSGFAGSKVRAAYDTYSRVPVPSGLTGHDTAVRLLSRNGLQKITVGQVPGQLTDHYHPLQNRVNLSEHTYNSVSVAASAVAAHEIGHVLQKETGYVPYRLRTAIVPVVNFGSRLSVPLVLTGLLLGAGTAAAGRTDLGYSLAMTGVWLYGFSVLFALVTLPVEYNASRRAKQLLLENHILTETELPGANAVLSAAAMTYLASLLVALFSFLRFLLLVLSAFGPRRGRRS